MIVKTNTSEYILIAILLIMIKKKKAHLVAFYSHIFKAAELNYNVYNKKLLIYNLSSVRVEDSKLYLLSFLFNFGLRVRISMTSHVTVSIADYFSLALSKPIENFPTRFSDNNQNSNLVLDLIFT